MDKNAKEDPQNVITANRFADGRVVWFVAPGDWSVKFKDAQIFSSISDLELAQEQAQKDVASQYIVEFYPVELNSDLLPRTTREQVRVFGPSTHPKFNSSSI